jgi:hypothetical protein
MWLVRSPLKSQVLFGDGSRQVGLSSGNQTPMKCAFFRTDQFSSTSIRALACSHQLRLYFRFCPSFGSGKW